MKAMSRAVFLGALVTVLSVGWAPSSRADSSPAVTIGDLKATNDGYQGVLTFRAKQVVPIDPQSVTATVDGKSVPITVQGTSHLQRIALLVIDTSGSMGNKGMQTVRQATAVYLKDVPSDVKVGVLRFASSTALVLKPTTNRGAVQKAVNGLTAGGNTALYAAVRQATEVLGTTGDRSIVLLSDGADTESKQPVKDLATDTTALKTRGIRVDVVRFNNRDKVAEQALAQFADSGGGSDVLATDGAGVAGAFQASAKALNSQAQFAVVPPTSLTGDHQLTITGKAAGEPFTISHPISFASAAPAKSVTASVSPAPAKQAPQSSMAPATEGRTWLPWFGGGLLSLAVFLFVYSVIAPSIRTRRERRIETIQSYVDAARHKKRVVHDRTPSALRERIAELGERIMSKRRSSADTLRLLERADLPIRVGEWLALRVVAVVLGAGVGATLLGNPVVGLVAGGLLGFGAPIGFLRFKAARRTKAFEKQLPQLLTLTATSLRSGFGLPQALDAVARDAAEPASKELSRALAQVRIGSDLAEALDEVAVRMGTQSLHMTVMAIRIQRQVGGNLAETLDTTAHTLRERESLRGQVAALSAEGRLSAWILIAMPVSIFFYMMAVANSYVAMLWTTTIGLLMLTGTIVLMVIGVFWMRKTVQIEV
ncbi:hypothetical protein GCM10027572_14810 [Flexivirga lutea]